MSHSWLNPKCEVRRTQYEHGVFARDSVLAGERIAISGGHVMSIRDEPVFSGGDYALQIAEEFVLGPKYEHELDDAEFVNHSCEPNAGFKGQIFLVAMRDIQPDEEIRFDYAMCLSPVEGIQYELQARYDGYFQWYLQEKINRLKK